MNFIPVNEAQVIMYYRQVQAQLGWHVIHLQRSCPDAIIKHSNGQRLRAEFEYESRNFKYHKHSPQDADVIICWKHNWPETPLPVWELSSMTSLGPRLVTQRKIETKTVPLGDNTMSKDIDALKFEMLTKHFAPRIRQLIRQEFGAAKSIKVIKSHRTGALSVEVGARLNDVYRKFTVNQGNSLRPYIPWEFTGIPFCYVDGHNLILGANWPEDWQEGKVLLSDAQRRYRKAFEGLGESEWMVGVDLLGGLVKAGFGDQSPHWLFAGGSGGGKSVGVLNMLLQLSAKGGKIVLADGKGGASLRRAENIQGVIGPCATTESQAHNAIEYVLNEMNGRYAVKNGRRFDWLYLVVDEFQTLCENKDIARNLAILAEQGRDAKIGLALVTQYPQLSAFGKDDRAKGIRRNTYGRIVYFLPDDSSSEVALGVSQPKAKYLTGAGDSFACLHGVVTRVQGYYADEKDIESTPRGEWEVKDWDNLYGEPITGLENPTIAAEITKSAAPLTLNNKRRNNGGMKDIKAYELGAVMLAASTGNGRPTIREWIHESGGTTGASRADKIRELYEGALSWICEKGYAEEFLEGLNKMSSETPD